MRSTSYFKKNRIMKRRRTNVCSAVLAIILTALGFAEANADRSVINRYKIDFDYQGIGYQILSESEKTVALCQDFDIDFAGAPESRSQQKIHYVRYGVGPNGFLMSNGLMGPIVVIPETVYDENGRSYTVTNIADESINYVGIGILALPPTIESLNRGICMVFGLSDIYLPAGLKEINGILHCSSLKNIHIPWNVEIIKKNSLWDCGLKKVYLPPTVKTLEDKVLSQCDSLTIAMLSEVESMGKECFSDCKSYMWANIPETLRTMGDGCFNGCSTMELVSLPWSEIKMNDCFNGCPSINRIEVLATEPYPFPANCFIDVDRSSCTLAVPVGSEDKYRAVEGWKEFHNIVGELPALNGSGVAVYPQNDFRVVSDKGIIKIISLSDIPIEVFSLDGEKKATVSTAGVSEISLPTGVYVVSSPYGSRKVAVM